jgi:DNA-nicking Smr family endonuclease
MEKKKLSTEHWEVVKWLETHEISLKEKYDLEHIPRRNKKQRTKRKSNHIVEETLDLHGFTEGEAAREIKSFIVSCKLKGCDLVKIIHGKGLHSPGEAKLKSLVIGFLNGEGRRYVSSWQEAPHNQGGAGAVLIYY